MSNLRIDPGIVDERQALLDRLAQSEAEQAEIRAQLASLTSTGAPGPSSFQHRRSPIHKPQSHHRSNVPRSLSSCGTSMSRQLSSDRTLHDGQRPRTLSQCSAPGASMARTNSRGTSSARSGNLPFTSNGNMPPPLYIESRRENPVIEAFLDQEQPYQPAYTFAQQHPQIQRSHSQRSPNLEQVPELGVGIDPSDWISQNAPSFSLTPSPVTVTADPMSNRTRNRFSTSSRHSQSFGIQTPTTPAESLTTASTLASDMSRQNSLCNEQLLEGVQMMKFNSNTSFFTNDQLIDDSTSQSCTPHYTSYANRPSSKEDQSLILFGTGGASHDSQFSNSFSAAEAVPHISSDSLEKMEMERSESSSSTSSTSSKSSRSQARLQAQIATARARVIKPKGVSDGDAMFGDKSSQSMTRLESKDGSQDKVAISKPNYVRPKHDRVYCKLCDDHPDGFRGEHELRRHHDRQHRPIVKKWMCVDPNPMDGLEHPKPILPLSKCKTCTQGKKKYGAYYNAAAHLRRAHFRPKAKGRSKAAKAEDKSEKRGGKAGGDWPSMTELKHWITDIDEPAPDFPLSESQQQAEDESDDESFDNIDDDRNSLASVTGANFNTFLDDVFPAPNTQQVYGMQGMHLDLHSPHSIDSSMQYPSSQNSFDSFPQSLLSNDALAAFPFDNSSFVGLDQPSVGLDFVNLPHFSYQ